MHQAIEPDFATFRAMAQKGNVVPVYSVRMADLTTPLSLYCKFPHGNHSFLLESIEGDDPWARFSLMGIAPRLIFKSSGSTVSIINNGREETFEVDNPLDKLRELFDSLKLVRPEDFPASPAAFVGYFSFDSYRYFRPDVPIMEKEPFEGPDIYLMFTDDLVLYDRFSNLLYIVHNVRLKPNDDLAKEYEKAVDRVSTLIKYVNGPLHEEYLWPIASSTDSTLQCNVEKTDFVETATEVKEAIDSGTIQQMSLAQRWFAKLQATPVNMYRAMRYVEPAPYGYYLKMGSLEVMGTSPEAMARTSNNEILLRSVGSETPRPGDPDSDMRVIEEISSNRKAISDIEMFLDQIRKDIAKVAQTDGIRESPLNVERTMRMFRLAASLRGHLKDGTSVFDVLKATFPDAMVCGVPRRESLELIEKVERDRRGVFGGGVGYIGLDNSMDLVTALRTVVIHRGKTHIQIGVPVNADSDANRLFENGSLSAEELFDALNSAAAGLEGKL